MNNLKHIALFVAFIVGIWGLGTAKGLMFPDHSRYRMSTWENQMVCENYYSRVECMERAK